MGRIVTNNRTVDILIEYIKDLLFNSVVKMQIDADELETVDSIRNADLYLASIDNTINFDMYNYDRIPLLNAGIPEKYIQSCMINRYVIPIQYRDKVLEEQRKYTIETYEETNDYYRMLNGIPKYKDDDSLLIVNYKSRRDYIHNFSDTDIEFMRVEGVLDNLIRSNPDKRYLQFLGKRRVSFYKSRKGTPFSLLYVPYIESIEIREKFIRLYEKNRVYTLKTVYSDAFEYLSNMYDNFISVFILIQTAVDLINDLPEIIVRKDFFDEMAIRDMFISHGVTHFPEIPFRYQLKMVKNLNTLLKYKSSDKNLIDICKLFGFDNITVFKYYLLKDRKMVGGEFIDPEYIINPDGSIGEPIKGSEYELKFVKVPLGENPDDYIRNDTNHLTYEEVVYNDIFWNGPGSTEELHEEIKYKILEQEFNYVHSKYISIDTLHDMASLSFEMVYFFNMVFDLIPKEELLVMKVKEIDYNVYFKMTDLICVLYILMYIRFDIEDNILDTQGKVLHVTKFNFEVNMSQIYNYIKEKRFTPEELGLEEFLIPDAPITTYSELIDIYVRNRNIYRHLKLMMQKADRYHMYKIYKDLFDSLMISQLNTSIFRDEYGNFAGTYTNYIKSRDPILYKFIKDLEAMEESDRISKCITTIDSIVQSMEEYIKSDDFEFSFSSMSNISAELIKGYLYKVIAFYKSYTVELLGLNTLYVINDQVENRMNFIDDLKLKSIYNFVNPNKDHYVDPDRVIFGRKSIRKFTNIGIEDDILIEEKYN